MVTHKEYNGWTNYETWNAALWIDNDQGSQEYAQELAREYRDDPYGLSKALESWIEEDAPDLGCSMFADLLGAAMSEIDWYSIAEHYLADLEPEEETGEDEGSESNDHAS